MATSDSKGSAMQNRIRRILEDLETVRENLLALSDDIWLSIDHNDTEGLEEGVQFKRTYNEKMAAFDTLASELSTMVQQFTAVRLESGEQSGEESESENERIIQELNREEPHAIGEDFTYKRPHGFILDGQATTGITTWRRLYELLCQQLLRRDPDRFRALLENPDFISNRGHHAFANVPDHLRHASSRWRRNLSRSARRASISGVVSLAAISPFARHSASPSLSNTSRPLRRALSKFIYSIGVDTNCVTNTDTSTSCLSRVSSLSTYSRSRLILVSRSEQ